MTNKLLGTHTDHQKYIEEGFRQGNTSVIQEIYQIYPKQILQWIKNNNGTASDAEDVFQDTMEVLLVKAKDPNFKLTCPLGAFLYHIWRRKWIDRLKEKNREKEVRIQEEDRYKGEVDALALAEKAIEEENCYQLMEASFHRLTTTCQQLLTLIKQKIKPIEIANRMGMNGASTVHRRKFACIKSWRKFIQESPNYHLCK